MYDKDYADIRIQNHLSGKDIYRKKHLEPFLQKSLKNLTNGENFLDIGCGWGTCLEFLDKNINYYGIDINEYFFDFIKRYFPDRKTDLQYGFLPDNIPFQKVFFDFAVCSQVLHTVKNLDDSLKNIFDKLKIGGKLIIITFAQSAKQSLIDFFVSVEKLEMSYIAGEYILPSGIKVWAEIYFHTEDEYEKNILRFADSKKTYLGDLFIAYECIKK